MTTNKVYTMQEQASHIFIYFTVEKEKMLKTLLSNYTEG